MLDLTRPVQTRAGKKARIICTDRVTTGVCSIVELISCGDYGEYTEVYSPDGRARTDKADSPQDLINIPEKRKMTAWVNVNRPGFKDYVYESKAAADCNGQHHRIKCIPVEIEYEV